MTKRTCYRRPRMGDVVSSGTLRTEDLLVRFALAVSYYYGQRKHAKLVHEALSLAERLTQNEKAPLELSERGGEVLDELFDLLDAIAPEGTYFGSHWGDGAEFGYWSTE